MQSATAGHITAINATVRTPDKTVRVDWPDGSDFSSDIADVTPAVTKVSVSRDMSTNLPSEVTRFEGVASAQATIDLAGEVAGKNIVAAVSPYNTVGEFYRSRAEGREVEVDLGMLSNTKLPQFRGNVTKVDASSSDRKVTVTALDYAEKCRQPASMPVVVASRKVSGLEIAPGLNAQWPVSWLLRKAGINTVPVRASEHFAASMHGSAFPEVALGTDPVSTSINTAYSRRYGIASTSNFPVRFADANFGLGMSIMDTDGWISYADYPASLPTGTGTVNIQCWTTPVSSPSAGLVTLWNAAGNGRFMEVKIDAGNLKLDYGSNFTTSLTTSTGPAISNGVSHYVQVRLVFTSTNVTVTWRLDGTTTGGGTLAVAAGAQSTFNKIGVGRGAVFATGDSLSIEAVTLDTQTGTAVFDNGFVPEAVLEPSKLELTAIPRVSGKDTWSVLQDIAYAELATAWFDESGIFRWWNRDHFNDTAGVTSVKDVTSTTSLKDLSVSTAAEMIRNDITVSTTPYTVGDWTAVWVMPGRGIDTLLTPGTTRTFKIDLSDPVIDVMGFGAYGGRYWLVNPSVGSFSSYYGNSEPDGSGMSMSNLAITTTVDSSGITLQITNNNVMDFYAVFPTGTLGETGSDIAGQASLFVAARLVEKADDPTLARAVGDTTDGTLPYSASDSDWRQRPADGVDLAYYLLGELEGPKPQFNNVPIVGDPRLQIGDVVRLSDPDGLVMTENVRVFGYTNTLTPGGGLETTLTVRGVYGPGTWILDPPAGYEGRDTIDDVNVLG